MHSNTKTDKFLKKLIKTNSYKLMEDASLMGDTLVKRDVCNLEDYAESADSL